MPVLETDRLLLCRLTPDDAAFMLDLLTDPAFLRFVGDKGVRTLDDARRYILDGPVAGYEAHGFGMWLVRLKESRARAGLCGLMKRAEYEDVDVGYAFLPAYRGRGYASEAARAVVDYGYRVIGLPRIVAMTAPGNARSIRVLEKIGLRFERTIRLPDGAPDGLLFGRPSPPERA